MTVSTLIGLVGGLIVIATALAVAYAVLKSTLARTTSELWRQEADALRTRLETVEAQDAACKERLAAVETANKVLADQVSGASAVALMAKQMERYYADIMGMLGTKRHGDVPPDG